MRVTVINGSPRKGNTYAATQLFKNEMAICGDVEFTEFFLPQDMPKLCVGCTSCFDKGEHTCPNSAYTMPIFDSIIGADAIIFTTPVYMMQTAGAVTSLFNHSGFLSLVHRPNRKMFSKKAFVISTTSAAGAKAAMKPIVASLKYWGVNRVYFTGITMKATEWNQIQPKLKDKIESGIKKSARQFYHEAASKKMHKPYLKTRLMFTMFRNAYKKYADKNSLDRLPLDIKYWVENDLINKRPF